MELLTIIAMGFGIGLVAGMTPGPDTVLVLRAVANGGARAGYRCALGIGAGLVFHTVLTLLSLFVLSAQLPGVIAALKVAGAGYLLYLAAQLFCTSYDETAATDVKAAGSHRYFWQGLITNVLNPKAIIFYLSVVSQFLGAGGGIDRALALLLGVALGPPAWFFGISRLANGITRWMTAGRRCAIDRVAGGLFVALAVYGLAAMAV